MKYNKNFKKSLIAITITALTTGSVSAEEAKNAALETITVTSQKRVQNLQEVPISVAVMSGSEIEDLGVTDLSTLSAYIPNLNIETSHNPGITIRGIGSGDNEGFEQSVGMYLDGIFMGRWIQYRNGLYDIERVEVLRGPQGTLFGKNTIAGAISMTTARPTSDFEAKFSYGRGFEFDTDEVEAVVSGGLTDTLSARVALKYIKKDGYLTNTRDGNDFAGDESKSGRLSLLWEPSDDLTVLFKTETSLTDTDGDFASRMIAVSNEPFGPFPSLLSTYQAADPLFDISNNETISKSTEDEFTRGLGLFQTLDTDNLMLEVVYDFANGGTLTSITGYSGYDRYYGFDVDFSPANHLYRYRTQFFDQYSQEVRYASPLGTKFEYIVGAFYQTADLKGGAETDAFSVLPELSFIYNFDQTTDTAAIFGQGLYHLSDKSKLEVGLRYTKEDKEATHDQSFYELIRSNGAPLIPAAPGLVGFMNSIGFTDHDVAGERSKSSVTWSLKYQYTFNSDVMGYASAASGFKSGGFNESYENSEEPFEYDDEEALAYEVGVKSTLLDGAMRLNAALYYNQITELQTSQLVGAAFIVANAGEAVAKGIELDAQWQATDNLYVTLGLAYNHARYEKFDAAGCTDAQAAITPRGTSCVQDLTGEPLQFAPDWTSSLGLHYDVYASDNVEITSRINWRFRDKQFLSQDNDDIDSQSAYTKTDFGFTVNYLPLELKFDLIASNVFDKRTKNGGSDVVNSRVAFPPGGHYEFTAPPRQIMLKVTKEFF